MANITHSEMQLYNRATVLNMVRQEAGLSRAEIAKRSGLSVPSISAIVSALIEDGLVREVGTGASQGGRKPIMLELNAQGRIVVALEIRTESTTGMLCDLNAKPIITKRIEFQEMISTEEKFTIASGIVRELIESAQDKSLVLGIGIGVVGVIDCRNRIVRYSAPFDCRNIHLDDYFGEFLSDYPIYVNNISRCETLAEKWFGHGRDKSDFLFIYAGVGIGGGVVTGGRLYSKSRYSGMEIGHNTVHAHGAQCRCGKHGCLEAYSALWSMKKKYAAVIGRESVSDEETLEAIEGRDPDIQEIVNEAIYYLGVEIANLTNIFNPETVIIDGWPQLLGQEIIQKLTDIVCNRAIEGLTDHFSIIHSVLANKGVVTGAATMVLQDFFQPLDKEFLG